MTPEQRREHHKKKHSRGRPRSPLTSNQRKEKQREYARDYAKRNRDKLALYRAARRERKKAAAQPEQPQNG